MPRLTAPSRRRHYSVGMTITEDMREVILQVPASAWTPDYDGDGQVRDGVWAAGPFRLVGLTNTKIKRRPKSRSHLPFRWAHE